MTARSISGSTSYGEVERELAVLLRRARAWNRDVATEVHPDLQPTAYALLSRVDELGSVRASDLGAYFGIDKGAISRQVALLERVGLVARAPDPRDGRAQPLVVTEEGRNRLAHARNGRRALVREQLDQWPPDEVATLARLLGRFNRQMDAVSGTGDQGRSR
jgi:DNA-binding MarR family transcriptional regulator